MAAIPHSGNDCSGLCNPPCGHAGCWQCETLAAQQMEARSVEISRRLMAAVGTRPAKINPADVSASQLADVAATRLAANAVRQITQSVLSATPAQTPDQTQKAMITREALTAVCERAGVGMNWNNGNPVFNDRMQGNPNPALDIERNRRAALERKVMELEDIIKKQQAQTLSAQAVQQVAGNGGLISGAMMKQMEDNLRKTLRASSPYFGEEGAARDRLREDGASDADIDAAKKLLGWSPEDNVASAQDAKLRQYLAELDAKMAGINKRNETLIPGPGISIVYTEPPLDPAKVATMAELVAMEKLRSEKYWSVKSNEMPGGPWGETPPPPNDRTYQTISIGGIINGWKTRLGVSQIVDKS